MLLARSRRGVRARHAFLGNSHLTAMALYASTLATHHGARVHGYEPCRAGAFLADCRVGAAVLAAACRGGGPPFVESDFRVPAGRRWAASGAGLLDVDLVRRHLPRIWASWPWTCAASRCSSSRTWSSTRTGHAINTHPLVVAGAADALRGAGAARGRRRRRAGTPARHRVPPHVDRPLRSAARTRSRVSSISTTTKCRRCATRSWFTGLARSRCRSRCCAADMVVSMPKLKTHHWAGMTCSMKNFFGVLPGAVYGWPKNILHMHGIDASILDLVATVRPHLTIVDGVVAMEGDGPIMGRPRPVGFLAMGTDLAAVDATCARIIGLDPHKMPYLDAAGHFLGNIDRVAIDQRGESPTRYRTDVRRHRRSSRCVASRADREILRQRGLDSWGRIGQPPLCVRTPTFCRRPGAVGARWRPAADGDADWTPLYRRRAGGHFLLLCSGRSARAFPRDRNLVRARRIPCICDSERDDCGLGCRSEVLACVAWRNWSGWLRDRRGSRQHGHGARKVRWQLFVMPDSLCAVRRPRLGSGLVVLGIRCSMAQSWLLNDTSGAT